MNANYNPIETYIIDTGKESSPTGKFWKNFLNRDPHDKMSRILIGNHKHEGRGQYAIGFKKKDSGEVYLAIFPGRGKERISGKQIRRLRKQLEQERGGPLTYVYSDRTRIEYSSPILDPADFSRLDLETKKRRKPVHCITFYNSEGHYIEELIYQRNNIPKFSSKIAIYLLKKLGIGKPFIKGLEKEAMKKIESIGIAGRYEKLDTIAKELEETGKYNVEVLCISETGKGMSHMPVPATDFEKFAFQE